MAYNLTRSQALKISGECVTSARSEAVRVWGTPMRNGKIRVPERALSAGSGEGRDWMTAIQFLIWALS